jgi:FAD/FMN-containing dehydrogenase
MSPHSVPLTPRGTGTSLNGQCCNVAVILDTSRSLNEIIEVNPEQKTARVQPGVIHDQLADITIRRHQLTFGPDTATPRWATFGGMIGNNSWCSFGHVRAVRAHL